MGETKAGTVETVTQEPAPPRKPWRIDVFGKLRWLKWLCTRRSFQFWAVLPNVVFFWFFLIAAVFGSPIGNRNIIIVFVWIFWWFLLIALMVPFVGRIWCTVCPFPFFGEWFQRRALIGARSGKNVGRNQMFGLNRRWPKALSNIWLQNIGFLALCTFGALLVTRPLVSLIVLGGLFVLATVFHMVFRQRAFCMYVCPVSGFLSLYAMTSMTELRAKDADVCAKCKEKGCVTGNEKGWGCPWFMYMSKMDRNNYCGLCMECVKTCPNDNITLKLRPFCSDTRLKGYDEAWKAFIMLAICLSYSLVLQGPWGFLKDWANVTEVRQWGAFALYASCLWVIALVIVPGIYWCSVWLGRRLAGPERATMKDAFLSLVYPLVPLGLMAWIAFSIALIMVNWSYIASVVSDPLGRGWDLFGTAHLQWAPFQPEWMAPLQAAILAVGLYFALRKGYGLARDRFGDKAIRAFAPTAVLLVAFTAGFLRLFVG